MTTNTTPPLKPEGAPFWIKHPHDPEDSERCVACGVAMNLNEGAEWPDDDAFRLCCGCATSLAEELWGKLEAAQREVERLRSALEPFTKRCYGFPGCGNCSDADFGHPVKCLCAIIEHNKALGNAKAALQGIPATQTGRLGERRVHGTVELVCVGECSSEFGEYVAAQWGDRVPYCFTAKYWDTLPVETATGGDGV